MTNGFLDINVILNRIVSSFFSPFYLKSKGILEVKFKLCIESSNVHLFNTWVEIYLYIIVFTSSNDSHLNAQTENKYLSNI